MSFVVLLVRLGLVGFSRVCRVSRVSIVRAGIRVSFSDRVGIGLPDVDWVELHVGFPTCRQDICIALYTEYDSCLRSSGMARVYQFYLPPTRFTFSHRPSPHFCRYSFPMPPRVGGCVGLGGSVTYRSGLA